MSSRVIRVTMFKIPSREAQQKYLENYRVLSATAVRDSKPYILSLHAGPVTDQEDARGQGFTLVAKSEFKDLADMEYYDKECEAHKVFKGKAKEVGHQGIMSVWYMPEVVVGTGM